MSDARTMVFIDPASGIEIRPLAPAEDEGAGEIAAAATGDGTAERGLAALREVRAADERNAVYGLFAHGDLVAVYGLRRDGMANEIGPIAVKAGERRKGYGRACLQDALRRSGRRPLVVETDEDGLAFYKACGFKLVGKRKQPSGAVRYRLGWHAPGRHFKGGTSSALQRPS